MLGAAAQTMLPATNSTRLARYAPLRPRDLANGAAKAAPQMALTTATVVVQAKKRRPPISGTTEGSTVATTRSDSAWIATPPVSMTEMAAFPLLKSASQPTVGVLSTATPVDREASLRSVSANTGAPPINVTHE